MKNSYLKIYTELYTKKYRQTEVLLQEVINDKNHHFWDACRDIAEEKLQFTRWKWLSRRIDDFAMEATRYISEKLYEWLRKARYGKGSLAKQIHSLRNTIEWLFERWVSVLKNLFDPRYKLYIPQSYILKYEDALGGYYA